MPTSSAYREAVLDDPEVAAVLASQPEPVGVARPRLSEYDQTTALLTDIYDRLGEVIAAVIVAANGKPPKLRPLPRPTTGLARARERVSAQRHDSLVAEVKAAQARWQLNQREGA